MSARLQLPASFAARMSRSLPTMQQLRFVHRLRSPAWSIPGPRHRRLLVLLASGVTSFAAYSSPRSLNSGPECAPAECAPSGLSSPAVATTVEQMNQTSIRSTDVGGLMKRCTHFVIVVFRCTCVSIVLFPATLLFLLNRISNGHIVCELSVARVLTSSLQFLGPAAIKFGQWASSRDDVFPPVVTQELGRLQSNAEPHALDHTLKEIEDMLRAFRSLAPSNAHVRLEDIDTTPIGSGSIAQVHRARLVGLGSDAAQNVVVKVLHPFVRERMLLDTQIFCGLASLMTHLPKAWTFGAEAAAAQFKAHLLAQLDLSIEHSNLQRFQSNFSSDSTVVFPTVFNGLFSGSCLVETWEEGEGLRTFFSRIERATQTQSHENIEPHHQRPPALSSTLTIQQPSTSDLLDRMSADQVLQLSRALGTAGARAFLKMLIRDNFVHVSSSRILSTHESLAMSHLVFQADLHPGNMIVRLELHKGRLLHKLVMCDAGLVGEMNPVATANFIELFHAVLRGDGRQAGLLMVQHAPRHECTDPEAFARGVALVVEGVASSGFQLKSASVSGILTQMLSLARLHRVQVDGSYATTAVALAILEGTGRRLNSTIDLFKLAFPLVVEERAKRLLHFG